MCDLYILVHTLIQKLQKKHRNLDYAKLINDLRLILGETGNIEFDKWHEDLEEGGIMYCTFTKKVLLLPEKLINGWGTETFVDKHHFMIEIFRMPLDSAPTLFNLLKIAIYT